ncbi:hypothetical protein, partial [Enterobacter hormaechei]|uniref:hypothetical protein n=1 Tax=Enterobacter hormaechei TaxID=158836 RepID=UPI001C3EB2A4
MKRIATIHVKAGYCLLLFPKESKKWKGATLLEHSYLAQSQRALACYMNKVIIFFNAISIHIIIV